MQSRSVLDVYKTIVNLNLYTCKIQLRSNIDYEGNSGLKISLENIRRGKLGLWKRLRNFLSNRKSDKLDGLNLKKKGPGKFTNEEEVRLNTIFNDYAKVTDILDSEKLSVTYYIDMPGETSITLHGQLIN